MASPVSSQLDRAWEALSIPHRKEEFGTILGVLYEGLQKAEVTPKEYEKLEVLLNKETSFFPDKSFPLMAIKPPLYLVKKAIELQEDMIRTDPGILVSQDRWDKVLNFDWMCQAVLIHPSLDILQHLHEKGCKLLPKFQGFLKNKEPTAASLFAMQEWEKQNMKEAAAFLSPNFAKAYSDEVVKFIFEKLVPQRAS